jgi:hypothetical protein
MTTRILPREEYGRLAGTEAESVWPHLDPKQARVIVVEDEGMIVGVWIAMRVLHAECLYIAPDYRKRSVVGRHLLKAMRHEADIAETGGVWTAANSAEIRLLLNRLGAKPVPGEHYIMPMGRTA